MAFWTISYLLCNPCCYLLVVDSHTVKLSMSHVCANQLPTSNLEMWPLSAANTCLHGVSMLILSQASRQGAHQPSGVGSSFTTGWFDWENRRLGKPLISRRSLPYLRTWSEHPLSVNSCMVPVGMLIYSTGRGIQQPISPVTWVTYSSHLCVEGDGSVACDVYQLTSMPQPCQ